MVAVSHWNGDGSVLKGARLPLKWDGLPFEWCARAYAAGCTQPAAAVRTAYVG
jgi:hypothetical protein